jgi:hypothetical protein
MNWLKLKNKDKKPSLQPTQGSSIPLLDINSNTTVVYERKNSTVDGLNKIGHSEYHQIVQVLSKIVFFYLF